jgi:hypothetical protein
MAERLSLSEIRGRSSGHFFDRAAMRFFSSSGWPSAKQRTTYSTRYDKKNGDNYVVVTDPWGTKHYHKFNTENGDLDPVRDEDIPFK